MNMNYTVVQERLKKMNKTLLIGILFVLTTIVARSQDITLSGIVIDKADKFPKQIPGNTRTHL